MSLWGHSRRFDGRPATSGLPPQTDMVTAGRHVSKVPRTEVAILANILVHHFQHMATSHVTS